MRRPDAVGGGHRHRRDHPARRRRRLDAGGRCWRGESAVRHLGRPGRRGLPGAPRVPGRSRARSSDDPDPARTGPRRSPAAREALGAAASAGRLGRARATRRSGPGRRVSSARRWGSRRSSRRPPPTGAFDLAEAGGQVFAATIARDYGLTGRAARTAPHVRPATTRSAQQRGPWPPGRVDVAIAGGVEPFSRLAMLGFARMRAIAPDGCRRSRAGRRGMMLGEGAAFLVLRDRRACGAARCRARWPRSAGSVWPPTRTTRPRRARTASGMAAAMRAGPASAPACARRRRLGQRARHRDAAVRRRRGAGAADGVRRRPSAGVERQGGDRPQPRRGHGGRGGGRVRSATGTAPNRNPAADARLDIVDAPAADWVMSGYAFGGLNSACSGAMIERSPRRAARRRRRTAPGRRRPCATGPATGCTSRPTGARRRWLLGGAHETGFGSRPPSRGRWSTARPSPRTTRRWRRPPTTWHRAWWRGRSWSGSRRPAGRRRGEDRCASCSTYACSGPRWSEGRRPQADHACRPSPRLPAEPPAGDRRAVPHARQPEVPGLIPAASDPGPSSTTDSATPPSRSCSPSTTRWACACLRTLDIASLAIR